jgi:arginase
MKGVMMIESNRREDLYLFFPQWQGSGKTNELYASAMLLHEALQERIPFTEVRVERMQELLIERGILGYAQIVQHLQAAHATLLKQQPQRIFTLGGDCGIEIAPISYLNQRYSGDVAVIWLDAHADANTPASSPSHTFHGMPLRVLLGEGDEQITSYAFSTLRPHQIFLAGARDLDAAEAQFIEQQGIVSFNCDQLTKHLEDCIETIQQRGLTHVYMHIDVDVLDPAYFPYLEYPTPRGLSVEALMQVREALIKNFHLVGGSVVEFLPPEEGSKAIEQLAALYMYPTDV